MQLEATRHMPDNVEDKSPQTAKKQRTKKSVRATNQIPTKNPQIKKSFSTTSLVRRSSSKLSPKKRKHILGSSNEREDQREQKKEKTVDSDDEVIASMVESERRK